MSVPDAFRLDAGDVVVLLAHLQTPIVANSGTASPKMIEAGARALAEASGVLCIPVLWSLTRQLNWPTTPLPSLEPFAREGDVFAHRVASPFMDPRFVERLEATGRRTLVVAGYATDAVVLFTALDALAAGYEVVVPIDACGARSTRVEEGALRRMERAGATTSSVIGVVMGCAPEFDEKPGSDAFAPVRTLLSTRD